MKVCYVNTRNHFLAEATPPLQFCLGYYTFPVKAHVVATTPPQGPSALFLSTTVSEEVVPIAVLTFDVFSFCSIFFNIKVAIVMIFGSYST